MDRLESMSVFLRVADLGSFSAAGRALRLPLPNVSRKVAELEAHLGVRLLVRTTRRLALTEAGESYRLAARRILAEVEEAERNAAGEFQAPRGELTLTAPLLFGRLHVLPIVVAFLSDYPEIDIRLALSDRNLEVIDEHVDAAVRIGPMTDSGLVATRLGAIRRVVCASPRLIARYGKPQSPNDLRPWPCVDFSALSSTSQWMFRAAPALEIRPRLSVTTAEAAVRAACEGVGAVRVLHYQCAQAVHAGELEILLEDFEPEPLPVHLINVQGRAPPLKTRAFLDFATERLRERLKRL